VGGPGGNWHFASILPVEKLEFVSSETKLLFEAKGFDRERNMVEKRN